MHKQENHRLPITLDSLANSSNELVQVGSKFTHLQGYEHLRECKCWRAMDRTEMALNGYGQDIVNVPRGFKNPLDFFDTVISKYLAERFHNQQEINIMSFGSGYLLHEVFIIIKLLKELKKFTERMPKIVLHAVDSIYKKSDEISEDAWKQSASFLCQEQFAILMKLLSVDVTLRTYSSLGLYDKENNINFPSIILAIDAPFRFDPYFPLPNEEKYSKTSLEYTQQGILEKTKELSQEGSLVASLTHLETNRGLFIILEEKVKREYKISWIHTISSANQHSVGPPASIEYEITEKANQYFSTSLGKYELTQKKRFQIAPLSQASMDPDISVKFRDDDGTTIRTLLNDKHIDINAQCADGFTALHWAAIHKNEKLIRELMRRGADLTLKTKYGRTALDYYKHQPCPDDFKNYIDDIFYKELCKMNKGSSTEVMPEINDAYFSRGWKEAAIAVKHSVESGTCLLLSKNQAQPAKPVVDIKDETKIQTPKAAAVSKPFIASPIHTAQSSTKRAAGNINLTYGSIQIKFEIISGTLDWLLEVLDTEKQTNRKYSMLYSGKRDKNDISHICNYLAERDILGLIAYIEDHGETAKAISQYLRVQIKTGDLKPKN